MRALLIAALVCLVCIGGSNAWAQAFANASGSSSRYSVTATTPSKMCESLSTFQAEGVVSISARVVPAAADAPQHCRVTGTITPEVAFEVNLPDQWNQRFYMVGNGGLAGDALDQPRNPNRSSGLANGFVVAQTNTGHDSRKEPSGTFVLNNPQKAIDYAYRAVHVTADLSKKLALEYYAKPVSFSYWNSCSNGGRQGLLEAQRYPTDFDGVVANAPWVDQTGFTMGAVWNQKAITEAPISTAKLGFVASKVMEKCDAIDGLKDGLIDDPRKCQFDPARDVPACSAGADGTDCLTAAEATTIKKIYGGPMSKGKPIFPGYMPGSESAWNGAVVPAQPTAKPADYNLAEGIMKYLVFAPPRADYDPLTFNFDTDVKLLDAWGMKANAKDADLSSFRKRGGKLIMTYGWADQILQPMMGVNYYEAITKKNGSSTADFARLFMVPGMTHCAGGIGPDQNDAVTAVIDWVEKGKAPDQLIASKITNGQTVRTRPLCPYPQVARYKGQGSIDEAASFSCVAPSK